MNYLVFDIGASNTKYGIMSESGNIISQSSVPTDYSSKENYLKNLVKVADQYKEQVKQIAISTNGRMHPDGNTYRSYTMDILKDVNLKEEIESRTGLPVSIENDGFSAALGEWWMGAGKGTQNMMGVVLGSGMGGGLILNGERYQGSRRNAAMIFGMLSEYSPEKCEISGLTTSFLGVLYMFANAKQIPFPEISGPKFFEFVEQGDPAAIGLLEKYCESIAVVIFNSAMLLDLDCIVVTGGLAKQDRIIEGINRHLKNIPEKIMSNPIMLQMVLFDRNDFDIKVKKGQLTSDANLYGALYHAMKQQSK